MIKDSCGYGRTLGLYKRWKQQYDEFVESKPADADRAWDNSRSSMEYDLKQLRDELDDYENLARGRLELPSLETIDGIGEALVRWRIAKGWSEKEISERVNIEFAIVLSYEARDYRTATLENLIKIRDLLRTKKPLDPVDYYQEAIDEAPRWENEEMPPS